MLRLELGRHKQQSEGEHNICTSRRRICHGHEWHVPELGKCNTGVEPHLQAAPKACLRK
jgi:hypothetical protein